MLIEEFFINIDIKNIGQEKNFFISCLKPIFLFNPKAIPIEIFIQSSIDGIDGIPVIIPPEIPESSYPALKILCAISEEEWLLGVGWFYKKQFNNRYRVPGSYKSKKAKYTEVYGDFLWAIYSLTSDIHACKHAFSKKYENASDWSAKIIEEWRIYQYSDLTSIFNNANKLHYITKLRNILNKLKEQKNPFTEYKNKGVLFHNWELIEAALEIRKNGLYPNLDKKHWVNKRVKHWSEYKGFIGSISALIQLIKSPVTEVMEIQGKKIMIHTGNKLKGTKGDYLVVNTDNIIVP